jgi:transcriptional regulator with XRE-family HTH domain
LWKHFTVIATVSCVDVAQDAIKALAKTVRRFRLEKGWSQEECAERAKIAPVYLSGVERGVRNPTVKVLARLARAFAVPLRDLFPPADIPLDLRSSSGVADKVKQVAEESDDR